MVGEVKWRKPSKPMLGVPVWELMEASHRRDLQGRREDDLRQGLFAEDLQASSLQLDGNTCAPSIFTMATR